MNRHDALHSRGWILVLVAIALAAAHLILFHVLWSSVASHVALPSAVVAGIVLILVAKHLGLLVGLVRILRDHFRRRS